MIRDHAVILQKNGKLWFCEYLSKELRGYKLTDISKDYRKYMFRSLVLGPGVTVKDILILAKRDLEFWKQIINNDLSFLEKPLIKLKNRNNDKANDLIDRVLISDYVEFQEKTEGSIMESGHTTPDIHGECDNPDKEGNTIFGIDWQWFNLYLDTPVLYGDSKIYLWNKKEEDNVGIIHFNLIDIMRLFLELHYVTVCPSDHEIEYITNLDTPTYPSL